MSVTPRSSPRSSPALVIHACSRGGSSTPGTPCTRWIPPGTLISSVNMHLTGPAAAALCGNDPLSARPGTAGMAERTRPRDPHVRCVHDSDRSLSPTPRTTLHRLRERGRLDRADLDEVLGAGLVCHLGVVIDGTPVVLPTGYGRIGDQLYLHGSSANKSLLAAAGQEACVTITLLDGLVCARAVFHHSMNYRSAVIFGTARLVEDPQEKLAALEAVTNHLVPGRWDHARATDPQGARRHRGARAAPGRGVGQGPVRRAQGRPGGLRHRSLGGGAAGGPRRSGPRCPIPRSATACRSPTTSPRWRTARAARRPGLLTECSYGSGSPRLGND